MSKNDDYGLYKHISKTFHKLIGCTIVLFLHVMIVLRRMIIFHSCEKYAHLILYGIKRFKVLAELNS